MSSMLPSLKIQLISSSRNVRLENQDHHFAIVPEVAIEFATFDEEVIVDDDEQELQEEQSKAAPPSSSPSSSSSFHRTSSANTFTLEAIVEDEDADGPSPIDKDEFAYPTNLCSEGTDNNDDEGVTLQEEQKNSAKKKTTKPPVIQTLNKQNHHQQQQQPITNKDIKNTEDEGITAVVVEMETPNMERGHFRNEDLSSGSDLIQVTVEDLIISEEKSQTIKASKSQARPSVGREYGFDQENRQYPNQQQDESAKEKEKIQSGTLARPAPPSNSSTGSSITTAMITATIRVTGEKTKSICFDDEDIYDKSSHTDNRGSAIEIQRHSLQPKEKQQEKAPENQRPKSTSVPRRESRPPAPPKILTPAQQREAEADANIQKAIELHENNQLEEATKYFGLAAKSENPLGQLMYGLSLRHGWGCKPNPIEAIVYLRRAAEYAMEELNELNPTVKSTTPPSPPPSSVIISSPTSDEKSAQQQQQHQQQEQLPPYSVPESEHQQLSEKPQGVQSPVSLPSSPSSPTSQTRAGEIVAAASGTETSSKQASHQKLRRMGSMDRSEAMVMARRELVMALYELGMSYLKGWGVSKDKGVAFTYFKIAADLGDADSQNETALCFYEGIGVDKDMFESARYYRMAAAQGASQLGNSWIWKSKYDQYCAAENAGAAAGAAHTLKKDRPRRFSSAIHTAFHGSSSGNTTKGGPGQNGQSGQKQGPISPPISPSIPSPHYGISSIASGLATVTAAATTGAVASSYGNSVRQSLISPSSTVSIPSSPPSTTTAASSRSFVPTFTRSARSMSVTSTSTSPTSPTSLSSFGSSSTSKTSPTATAAASGVKGEALEMPSSPERKKTRWSLWGGLRSNPTLSATTSSQ